MRACSLQNYSKKIQGLQPQPLLCLFVLRQLCRRDILTTFKKLHSKNHTTFSILELKPNITYWMFTDILKVLHSLICRAASSSGMPSRDLGSPRKGQESAKKGHKGGLQDEGGTRRGWGNLELFNLERRKLWCDLIVAFQKGPNL